MSVPSKSLVKSLRREMHTDASLNALNAEFHKAEADGVDAKFRQYRVIASLALSVRDDGSEVTSKFVRDAIASDTRYDHEDGTVETSPAVKLTDARIRQVKSVFVIAKTFALDLFSEDTTNISRYWADLDAIRRGGKNLVKLYDATTLDAARDAVMTDSAKSDGSTLDALEAMARDARDLRSREAKKKEEERRKKEEEAAAAKRSPEAGKDDSPAGNPASDPGNSDGTVTPREEAEAIASQKAPEKDVSGPEVTEEAPIVRGDNLGPEEAFLSTLRALVQVDVSGMTQDGHAEALDLLTVLQENLLSAGDTVAA